MLQMAASSGQTGPARVLCLDASPAPAAPEVNWVIALRRVSEAAARQFEVEVVSARLISSGAPSAEKRVARFEIECDRGLLHAELTWNGEYSFRWLEPKA